MKPILYSPNETAFDTNGIGVLTDAAECRVVAELNGQYELALRYPITGIHYKDIVRRAIILAKPDPVSDPQPFRIYHRVPSSQGTITVFARHVAYDLMGNVVSPFGTTGVAAALQALKDNSVNDCPFTFWTDKTTAASMLVPAPASIWSLLGGTAGSVLDVFGGEYEFDHFTVKLWTRRGSDRGVSIRYGKNLTSLEQDENISNTYTAVYPYWQDAEGNLVQLPEKTVSVPGTFDHVRIMPLDLSTEWQSAPTEDQLRERTAKYIADNDIGTPSVSWTVKHVDLAQTEEYKNKAILEQMFLGDTASVEFADMGISATSRVVATDFDVLAEIYNSTTLGSVKANIADTIVQQGQQLQDTKKEVIHYVTTENAKLNQLELLKRLTKEWVDDGIYLTEDGKIGINASALLTGIIGSKDGKLQIDLSGGTAPVFNTGISTNGLSVRGDSVGAPEVFLVDAIKGQVGGKDVETFRVVFVSADGTQRGNISETFDASTYEPTGITQRFTNKDRTRGVNLFASTSQAGIELYNGNVSDTSARAGRFYVSSKGYSVLDTDTVNPGKKALFSGSCAVGSSCAIGSAETGKYDLFAVKLGDDAGTSDTVVLAYKTGNVIRGVGGWAGTSTDAKQLYFFSATFSGDTWTVQDAGVHVVNYGGGIGAGTRLQLKEVIGII